MVRSDLSQQQRVRSVAVPRRRWQKISGEHALGPPARKQSFRRNCPAGILGEGAQAHRRAENIFKGTPLGLTEGPHLFKRNGWYYLLTAEGGTGWGHTVTLARSRNLTGPYELHPDTHILSARNRPECELQKSGHASLVETQNGETYMVYLCARPLKNRGRCTLGRETAIQKMVWGKDGWLRTLDGQPVPTLETPAPKLPATNFRPHPPVKISTDRNCRLISNGSAPRGRRNFSASPRVRVFCGCLDAKRSAVLSGNH